MERDVAFDLLHHLMDVAVEHGHRTEALEHVECTRAVFSAPTPGRIDRPQRDVREQHDRRRGRAALEIGVEPGELVGAEATMPPTFRFFTLTRPMKCTPPASKLYQPSPFAPRA